MPSSRTLYPIKTFINGVILATVKALVYDYSIRKKVCYIK